MSRQPIDDYTRMVRKVERAHGIERERAAAAERIAIARRDQGPLPIGWEWMGGRNEQLQMLDALAQPSAWKPFAIVVRRVPTAVAEMPALRDPAMNWRGIVYVLAIGASSAVACALAWAAWHWARVAWEALRWVAAWVSTHAIWRQG